MKKGIFTLLSFCLLLLCGPHASAKIWRVNNNAGINANFTDFPAAVTGASAGDTIYLESSATAYSYTPVAKRLVIIGSGYFLSGSPVNPNTQANTNPSTINEIDFNVGSGGSVVEGLTITGGIYLGDSAVTIERNYLPSSYVYLCYSTNSNKDTIRQNFMYGISGYSAGKTANNTMIYNNIIESGITLTTVISTSSGYIINNDIGNMYYGAASLTVANFEIQNNVLYNPGFGAYLNSNVYFNNISTNAVIPAGNANVNSATYSTLYLGGNNTGYPPPQIHTTDSAYTLAVGSPAIGAGALNGSTVDCGAFGGPAPYVFSGMPSGIPSIYALTAPVQVNSGTASINVTISSASH